MGVVLEQPRVAEDRDAIAGQCSAALELATPMLVDDMEDSAERAFSAFPDRIYIVDRAGKIAFKSGRGPYGFDPRAAEIELVSLLLDEAVAR